MDRSSAPTREEWRLDDLEAALADERQRLGRPLVAVFLDDLYELFYRAFQRDLLRDPLFRHQDLLLITKCADRAWIESVFESVPELDRMIGDVDVVVMRYGVPNDPADQAFRGRRCEVFWTRTEGFEQRVELPLQDGTSIRAWVRRRGRGGG